MGMGNNAVQGVVASTAAGQAALVPKAPDPADEAVRNARLMERRKQLGLQGRMSTFLTTAQGDQTTAAPRAQQTLLGG